MAEKTTAFKMQLLETTASLITAGFGIVAALAWNEAIKELITRYIPKDEGSDIIGLFVYAVIVTIVVVAASLLVSRSIAKLKEADAKLHKSDNEESQ